MNEEHQYIKEILETKFDAFAELLKSELGHLKEEVKKIELNLETHRSTSDEETVKMEQSIVRIHLRIDSLEERLKKAETPAKPNRLEQIKTAAISWAVPILMISIVWLIGSGTIEKFIDFILHLNK